tara:strand:+ start:2194 stop:2721 length:528 start_codon:yes stop_codon:yes gene_type:complete
MELSNEERTFKRRLLIEKGFKYYAEKCGVLESENEELKYFEEENKKLQGYKAEIEELQQKLEKLNQKNSSYLNQITQLQNKNSKYKELISIEKKHLNHNSDVSVIESKKEVKLKNRVEGQKSQIDSLLSALNKRNDLVKELSEKIESNGEVKRLKKFIKNSKQYLSKEEFLGCFE